MPTRDELVSYLKKQLKAGYNLRELRNHLLQLGYDPTLVGESIDAIYAKKKPLQWKPIILISILCILIISGSLFFFLKKEVLPERALPQKDLVVPIEVIEPIEVEGPEEEEEYDVFREDIEKRLKEREEQQKIEAEKETISKKRIEEAPEVNFEEIVSLLREKPAPQAVALCRQLEIREKNQCFKLVALQHNNTGYCAEVEDTGIRDNCYISFAFSEEYQVCDKIINKYLQLSCRTLGRSARYDENALLSQILGNETVSILEGAGIIETTKNKLTIKEIAREEPTEIKPKVISITFEKGIFRPSYISVYQNKPYILFVTSIGEVGGISIPEFEINRALPQDQTISIEITFGKLGEVPFSCNTFCAPEYEERKGIIRVEIESE